MMEEKMDTIGNYSMHAKHGHVLLLIYYIMIGYLLNSK